MDGNFTPSLEGFTWRPENDGQGPHVTRGDRGGATSWGMTWRTWCGWCQANGLPAPAPEEFLALDRTAFEPAYHVLMWNAVQADRLPAGVDLCVFDFAVGSGPFWAAKLLQMIVGVAQDGRIGPVTLAAVARQDPRDVIDALTLRDEAYYASLSDFRVFGRGWDRRREDCKRLALEMAHAAKPPLSV